MTTSNEERTLSFIDAKIYSLRREIELCHEVRGMLTSVNGAAMPKKRGRPPKNHDSRLDAPYTVSLKPKGDGRGKRMPQEMRDLIVEFASSKPAVTTREVIDYLIAQKVNHTDKHTALSAAVRNTLHRAGFKRKGERDKATWSAKGRKK